MRPEEFKFSRKKLNLMHPNVQQLIPSAVRSHKYVHQFIRLSQLQPLIPLSEASPLSQVPHLLHSHRYTRSVDTLADKYNCIGTLTGTGSVCFYLWHFHLWGLLLIGYVYFRVCRLLSLSPMGFVAVCKMGYLLWTRVWRVLFFRVGGPRQTRRQSRPCPRDRPASTPSGDSASGSTPGCAYPTWTCWWTIP